MRGVEICERGPHPPANMDPVVSESTCNLIKLLSCQYGGHIRLSTIPLLLYIRTIDVLEKVFPFLGYRWE